MIHLAAGLVASLAAAAPDPVVALIPATRCGAPACEASARLSELHAALARASARRPLRPLSAEALFVEAGPGIEEKILGCGPELECVCASAGSMRAELLFVLVAIDEPERRLLGLRLIDCEGCRIAGQDVLEPAPGADLVALVEPLAAAVLDRAGHARWARLQVDVEPAGATIAAAELAAEPGAPSVFLARAGRYTISAAAPGHEPRVVSVELAAGEDRRMEITLEREASLLESPWLWIAAGVVAAAAVTTTVVWIGRDEIVCVPAPGRGCEL